MAKVTDLETADHAARRIAQLTAERARVKQQWDDQRDKALAKIDRKAEFYDGELVRWFRAQCEADEDGDPTEPQTLELPCGSSLAYRPNPVGRQRLVVTDADLLLKWADEANVEVRKPGAIDNATVRQLIEDGAEVEGAELVDPDWQLYSVSMPKRVVAAEGAVETDDEDDEETEQA